MDQEKVLTYIYNHVFLPPKLPSEDDSKIQADETLTVLFAEALAEFQVHVPKEMEAEFSSCLKTIEIMRGLRDGHGNFLAKELGAAICDLEEKGAIAIHIRAQNAGLLIRRRDQVFTFESFELSPSMDKIMKAKGRLVRFFPGPAIAVDAIHITDPGFIKVFTTAIADLDVNTPREAWAFVKHPDAGTDFPEIRGTVEPRFVTEMLTSILYAIGQPFDSHRIQKNTRDDVIWKNNLMPWRRSPYWLFLKVIVQLCLFNGSSHKLYKSFMIHFMSKIIQTSVEEEENSEMLFVMQAKVSRRILKLDLNNETSWLIEVKRIMERCEIHMKRIWTAIEDGEALTVTRPPFNFSYVIEDKNLSLEYLSAYLEKRRMQDIDMPISNIETNDRPRRIGGPDNLPDPNILIHTRQEDTELMLQDLEQWVELHLTEWLERNYSSNDTCVQLAALIRFYVDKADPLYKDFPEDHSIMFLTSIELWIALDRCACLKQPILKKYNPGFSETLFNPLLLRTQSQIMRIAEVEKYLKDRVSKVKDNKRDPSLVFDSAGSDKSLAVCYFRNSGRLRALQKRIEEKARKERDEKRTELAEGRENYRRLLIDSKARECNSQFQWRKGKRVAVHQAKQCQKCKKRIEAEKLTIDIHEWPIIQGEKKLSKTRCAVFELDVPQVIYVWRETTYHLLVNVFSDKEDTECLGARPETQNIWTLRRYSGLEPYCKTPPGILQLASFTQPFEVGRYKNQALSVATESTICVPNALNFKMFDSRSRIWVGKRLSNHSIRNIQTKCTFSLPSGPFSSLKYAIENTNHTSNEVIASQGRRPPELSEQLHYAFGTLRSGHLLQWRNLARELAIPNLNFNHEETYLLITQAILQLGPSGGGDKKFRESHQDLADEDFSLSLLDRLGHRLEAAKDNWQEATSIKIFIEIVGKILTLAPSPIEAENTQAKARCLQFLKRARGILIHWCWCLERRLEEDNDQVSDAELRMQILNISLICHTSFGIDAGQPESIFEDDDDLVQYYQCLVWVHEHCPAVRSELPTTLERMIRRYKRINHSLETFIRAELQLSSVPLDEVVSRQWASYRRGALWRVKEQPNHCWVEAKVPGHHGNKLMLMHFNFLTGALLMNGHPPSRLPGSYGRREAYQHLFGKKILSVVPSSIPNMCFETRQKVHGLQLHFRLQKPENNLIILAVRDSQVWELIPHTALLGDFPSAFIHGYVHWQDLNTEIIEWRPLSDPWIPNPNNWSMVQEAGGKALKKNGTSLVDIRSPTAAYVLSIFQPLEKETYIHTIVGDIRNELDISLSWMNLHFNLHENNQAIQSKEFPGMVVDEDQSIGIFSGLVNKLVLRSPRTKKRLVIVPHGEVEYKLSGQHVVVEIKKNRENRIRFHTYEIDLLLNRIKDKGGLTTKLFKCLLHAVTSHHIPDSLTRRTGTEEALFILKEASTNSFYELCADDISILEQIAKLCPAHSFYPRYARLMQEIDWIKLPTLSQHPHFWALISDFYQSIKSQKMFHHEGNWPVKEANFPLNDNYLLERQAIRTAVFRTEGFGAEDFKVTDDLQYDSREFRKVSRGTSVTKIARLVESWSENLGPSTHELLQLIQSWGKPIRRWNPEIEDISMLGYNLVWLDEPKDFLPEYWLTLQSMVSRSRAEEHKYQLMFFLSTLSYSEQANVPVIYTLLAFATIPELHNQVVPNYSIFELSDGYEPTRDKLLEKLRPYCLRYNQLSDTHDIYPFPTEGSDDFAQRRKEYLQTKIHNQFEKFVGEIMNQWPAERVPLSIGEGYEDYIKIDGALGCVNGLFCSWYRNRRFKVYVDSLSAILQNRPAARPDEIKPYAFEKPRKTRMIYTTHLTRSGIFKGEAPSVPEYPFCDTSQWFTFKPSNDVDVTSVQKLCTRLYRHRPGNFGKQYRDDLTGSLESLQPRTSSLMELGIPLRDVIQHLEHYRRTSSAHLERVLTMIHQSLEGPTNTAPTNRIVSACFLSPRIPILTLLAVYTRRNTIPVSQQWISALHQLALSITAVQRANRLSNLTDDSELVSELKNIGHQGWNPKDYPEWLVFEIENDILIRESQARTALEMIQPSSRQNSIMQLNMGDGKSSVIVPIVAAALADTKKLVRVVVLKPLLNQMFHILVQRLGGALRRRIYFLPLSRSPGLDKNAASYLRLAFESCKSSGGILLVQPEHLLSFELMGLDHVLSGRGILGKSLINMQEDLDKVSRDILDESDEVLGVDLELVYTVGSQRHIDFSPTRWAIIEDLLTMTWKSMESVLNKHPGGLEVSKWDDGKSVRSLRVLLPAAGHDLLNEVGKRVCDEGVGQLSFQFYSGEIRKAMCRFITKPQNTQKDMELLDKHVWKTEHSRAGLLLLRGLIAGGILMFALSEKRYRVNYGLDLSRTMLAVPFRAKDQPASRSEFSHPDATIILTCLSYYAAGLSTDQLQLAFEKLLASDHPEDEYSGWTWGISTLPEALQTLSGVNLDDSGQFLETIFPLFRSNKKTIDFYLSDYVFPSAIREFPHKISSSGWNIAKKKKHLTTGFSGTKDSRYMLPLSIIQQDIPEQSHISSLQLKHILKPQNRFHRVSSESGGLDIEPLLKAVVDLQPSVRVIIDVGAQVLELENDQVAERWLSLTTEEVQAAVYFNSENELWVYSRDGVRAPLYSSTYEQRMDECLIYLDEVHTRGTDLRLPKNYRAVVTLGPGLTKDRLVQACMRMRRLADGQSIIFIAPPEVEQKILKVCKKDYDEIEVCDVLEWSITETYAHIKRSIPRWGVQGLRYQRHEKVWSDIYNTKYTAELPAIVKSCLELEGLSIDQRYGITATNPENEILQGRGEEAPYKGREEQVDAIKEKCQKYKLKSFQVASVEEMQERELQPEKEQEIQIEQPNPLSAAKHNFHKDVIRFAREGTLPPSSAAFLPVFDALKETSASKFLKQHDLPTDLLVTTDFANTVVHTKQKMDLYLRPVHWVLSREISGTRIYMIISPSEANNLMSLIAKTQDAALHIYSPRINSSSPSLEDLSFCAVSGGRPPPPPSHIVMLINIFAGQMHLRSYEAYLELCQFLGVCHTRPDPRMSVQVESDGFIKPEDREEYDRDMAKSCGFKTSPMEFLRKLIGIRRGGKGAQHSHVGKMLNGTPVQPHDFVDANFGDEMDID